MQELSGPVIGIALVLSAVFVPTAFIPGITGRLYQQFAVTIAISVLLSAFNALTLSPALAALLLDPRNRAEDCSTDFRLFNRVFGRANGWVCPFKCGLDPQERRCNSGRWRSSALRLPFWQSVAFELSAR